MNDGKIAAPREVLDVVSAENFNLAWAYVDWALGAGRLRLSVEVVEAFRQIPRECKEGGDSLALLNHWLESNLSSATRLRIFSDIRKAQFEAAKGAVQITISEETQALLRQRKIALFGKDRGSMEVTIRHLLETEKLSLSLHAFRLLDNFRQRHHLHTLSDAVRVLVDHVELSTEMEQQGSNSEALLKEISMFSKALDKIGKQGVEGVG